MQWYGGIPPSKILDFDGQRLYIGNIYQTRKLAFNGNPLGIQAVLDVSTEDDYEQNPDIMYLRVPFPDGYEIPALSFAECMAYLTECWDNKRTIFLNCAAGISRSPSIACSFIYYSEIGYFGFTPPLDTIDKIMNYISLCRPIVQPAPSVIRSCKKHLKIYPYDGSLGEAEPAVRIDKRTFAKQMKLHPKKDCPIRLSILANDDSERHLLKCTCGFSL